MYREIQNISLQTYIHNDVYIDMSYVYNFLGLTFRSVWILVSHGKRPGYVGIHGSLAGFKVGMLWSGKADPPAKAVRTIQRALALSTVNLGAPYIYPSSFQ